VARALLIAGSNNSSSGDFGYDLDLDKAVEMIRKCGAKRVALAGTRRAEEGNACYCQTDRKRDWCGEVIISGDPCFGACDVDISSARRWT